MMRRRRFLEWLGGGLLVVAPGPRLAHPAASTQAIPTLFHAHPDGATTLVRFVATGWDVPAGRLRVRAGRTGRLLGTAGMVRRGNELVGELWLPLTAPLTVYSDLETPSRRGMQRTLHRLTPTPRWVIHYLALAAPDVIAARAARVPPLLRGTEAIRLVPAGIRINAWHPFSAEAKPDHLDLLRLAVPAVQASRMSGVPVGRIAMVAVDAADPRLVSALRGAQVAAITTRADVTDAATLGLTEGRAEAGRRIEPWLLAQPDVPAHPIALVISTDPSVALSARSTVEDWNAAYAYPRLQVGDEDGAVAFLARRSVTASATGQEGTPTIPLVTGAAAPSLDPDTLFLPLARRLAPDAPTLDGIARRFTFPVAGTLVFNPSPFSRTDVVRDADGGFRVVTDVPALGYAFVPETTGTMPESGPSGTQISSEHARVSVERDSGSIASLRDAATGLELVAPGTAINQPDHAVLADMHVETIPGVGHRIAARRMTPDGALVSTVSVFDSLPWLEIENQFTELPDHRVAVIRFPFAPRFSHLRWECAGGLVEADAPVPRFGTLRWAVLQGPDGNLLLGMAGIAAGSLTDDGTLVLEGGRRQVLRLRWQPGLLLPDDPWRFGYGMLPLVGHTTGGGGGELPTFGRMVDVRDPMIAIVGIKPADDGVGVIVYLMDVGDAARSVPIQPGLLPFSAAVLTDLAERDLQPIAIGTDGTIAVPIERSGYAAVRLLNTEAE